MLSGWEWGSEALKISYFHKLEYFIKKILVLISDGGMHDVDDILKLVKNYENDFLWIIKTYNI
jgi:hypothetical protein